MKTSELMSSMDFRQDWENWRKSFNEGIELARMLRLSLCERSSEGNPEEQLLKEMWNVGSPDERKTMAAILLKVVQEHFRVFNNTCSFLADSRNWYMWEEYEIVDGGTPWA
jgi:hypothetical protein